LRAFGAVVRLGTSVAAGKELGVTHGAVSRKIGDLADGRLILIPPACVNMEAGVLVKPEYVVKV
jgi:hypothetical protein